MSIKPQKKAASLIVMSVAILLTISSVIIIIFISLGKGSTTSTAAAQRTTSRGYPFGGQNIHFRFGTIGSIQNGEDGRPQWIVSGVW
jgi:hypothetical protein